MLSDPKREGEILTSQGTQGIREAQLGATLNGNMESPLPRGGNLGRCSDTLHTKMWPALWVLMAIGHVGQSQPSMFQDVAKRKRFVGLVDSVREFGGDVKIFSSLHVSGEQLDQLTGLCAVLRYIS